MNTPNKLTVLRFILSAVFFAIAMIDFPHHWLIALVVFIIASITDLLDGKIARKHNLVTDFGKFLDPIADKMLTTAAFLVFTFKHIGAGVVVITFIVLAREFIVTSLRLIAADKQTVIAANIWGKTKTVMQMIAIITTLVFLYAMELFSFPEIVCTVLTVIYTVCLWISAFFTVVAGVTYIVDNRKFLNYKK